MFCQKCGKELLNNAKFCMYCGKEAEKCVSNREGDEQLSHYSVISKIDLEEFHLGKNLTTIISLVVMVIAIICCFMPWFNLPGMGSYTTIGWIDFSSKCDYYLSPKVYEMANIIPAIFIWVHIPIIAYVTNVIVICRNRRNAIGLEIIGLVFSVFTLVYANIFFSHYNRYVLGNYSRGSMSGAFYLMIVLVLIDIIRSAIHVKNRKKEKELRVEELKQKRKATYEEIGHLLYEQTREHPLPGLQVMFQELEKIRRTGMGNKEEKEMLKEIGMLFYEMTWKYPVEEFKDLFERVEVLEAEWEQCVWGEE